MNEWVCKADFRKGLVLALSEKQNRLEIRSTKELHRAFGETINEAKKTMPSTRFEFLSSIESDPIISKSETLGELFLEAEADHFLDFTNNAICFQLSKEEAKKDLERLPHAGWFRSLADFLLDKLGERSHVVEI